jgi:CDP-2,3-bis-(O-geranylgeranyl)-sn-glycerol synthase
MHPAAIGQILILLALANGAPVMAKRLFGSYLNYPIDGGIRLADGQPVLGPSKTVRGILLAIIVTWAGALAMGLGSRIGLTIGSLAMVGDLSSSFLKRRFRLTPSSRATGLDQIPESLLPALACKSSLALSLADLVAVVTLFFVGEVLVSLVLFRLRLRDQPY